MSSNAWMVILIVGVIAIADVAIFSTLFTLARAQWKPIADNFPPVEPLDGAERRNFQSFHIGLFSLGCCIHVASDEAFVHLYPARIARWLGITNVSIPRTEIHLPEGARKGKYIKTKVLDTTMSGPRWCLAPDSLTPELLPSGA